MGCYTQFNAKIPLRKDTPDDVVLLIMHAVYDPDFSTIYISGELEESQHPLTLPDHRFFRTERWDLIFMGPNQEHDKGATFIRSKSGYYDLEIHCDINYGYEEVKYFIDWIKPYVAGRQKKQYIGWWTNDNINFRCNEYVER